jgi:cell division protein FtsL
MNSPFMLYRKSEMGFGSLGSLFFVFIILLVVFVASQVIPFYYSYYEINGLMQAQANISSELSDRDIRRNITQEIKKLNLPVNPEEDLKINRTNGGIVIDLYYQEVLYVDFGNGYDYDLWTFTFNPRGER